MDMAPALLWLLDFLSLAAAALLLHPTKNFAPDQTCVLNLSSKVHLKGNACARCSLQRTKIGNDLHLMQDPQMPPESPKCQALKCSACVSASLSFSFCIWKTARAHCPTKMQVKGNQSHCHPRRHHYHHQPHHRSPPLSAFEFCSTEARTSKDCSLRLSISCRCCSAVAAVEAFWASQKYR